MVFSIGVFSGTLFQYNNSTTPSLIASESLLTLWYHIWRPPSMLLNLKQQQHTSTTKEKCICKTYVGLSDRPITTPYTKLLEEECRSLVWSPCPVNTREVSSLAGRVHTWTFFGHGSFCQFVRLFGSTSLCWILRLLAVSTGCQNSIHSWSTLVTMIISTKLLHRRWCRRRRRWCKSSSSSSSPTQAPVSDRESYQDNSKNTTCTTTTSITKSRWMMKWCPRFIIFGHQL